MRLFLRGSIILCLGLITSISAFTANFTVSSLNDAGPGSLADALNGANSSPGLDSIHFSLAGTINMNGQLPAITDPVVIDGGTAPGYVSCGAPVVGLNFVGGGGAHGLLILAGGAGTTVRGLNIRGFTAAGISSEFSSNITVQSCYIGTDLTGTVAVPNNLGILLLGSPDCVIGGDSCEGNIVCGSIANGIAMELGCHRTVVAGNSVGLGADGTTLMGNGLEGIYAYDSDSLKIGLAGPGMGNIVTGSGAQGIHLNGGGNGSSNALIYNNLVGTNGSGGNGYGNGLNGIFLEGGTSGTQIGGTGNFQQNTITDNGLNGVQIDSANNRNLIVGNSIYCNFSAGILLYFANDLIPILPNLSNSPDSVFGTGGTPGNMVHAYRNTTNGDTLYCDCEGEEYIGSATVDASGNWAVVHNLGLTTTEQGSVTATQTDAQNNTSELFAPCSGGVFVGLSPQSKDAGLTIFPNPTTGNFKVEFESSLSKVSLIQIFDNQGKLVFRQNSDSNPNLTHSSIIEIDATGWSKGIYFIKVDGIDRILTGRLLLN